MIYSRASDRLRTWRSAQRSRATQVSGGGVSVWVVGLGSRDSTDRFVNLVFGGPLARQFYFTERKSRLFSRNGVGLVFALIALGLLLTRTA